MNSNHQRPLSFLRPVCLSALILISTILFTACTNKTDTPGTSPEPAITSSSPSPVASSTPTASPDPRESPSTDSEAPEFPAFDALIGLLGMTKEELLASVPETPEPVDEGGLGFDKSGVRVWFDAETYTKVAQIIIMSDQIDINGVFVGGDYDDFKAEFGEPISDTNGDAHFKYGDIYLSVVRDTNTDTVIAVYILAEDF